MLLNFEVFLWCFISEMKFSFIGWHNLPKFFDENFFILFKWNIWIIIFINDAENLGNFIFYNSTVPIKKNYVFFVKQIRSRREDAFSFVLLLLVPALCTVYMCNFIFETQKRISLWNEWGGKHFCVLIPLINWTHIDTHFNSTWL